MVGAEGLLSSPHELRAPRTGAHEHTAGSGIPRESDVGALSPTTNDRARSIANRAAA